MSAALADDEDTRQEYIAFLHLRGDRETFEAARSLCGEADPVRRELGVYVLGQLGVIRLAADGTTVGRPHDQLSFHTPAAPLLLGLAATETADTAGRVARPYRTGGPGSGSSWSGGVTGGAGSGVHASGAWGLPVPSRSGIEAAGFAVIEDRHPSFLLDGVLLVTGEVDRTPDPRRTGCRAPRAFHAPSAG